MARPKKVIEEDEQPEEAEEDIDDSPEEEPEAEEEIQKPKKVKPEARVMTEEEERAELARQLQLIQNRIKHIEARRSTEEFMLTAPGRLRKIEDEIKELLTRIAQLEENFKILIRK